jgi:hypothetical protein
MLAWPGSEGNPGHLPAPYGGSIPSLPLVWTLAAYGSFQWNATLSAVSRLFVSGSTCVAMIVLRRRRPGDAWLHLPGGAALAAGGIGFCALLATRMGAGELTALAAVALLALVHWLIVRRTRAASERAG